MPQVDPRVAAMLAARMAGARRPMRPGMPPPGMMPAGGPPPSGPAGMPPPGMPPSPGMKKGGKTKKFAKGGSVSSASARADGIAMSGKTKGRFC